jgi:CheY-like chemotaxis protein
LREALSLSLSLSLSLPAALKRAEELEHEVLERKQAESVARHERDRAQRYLDTGLGLATVHGIVTRIGGSVDVYSEVGNGTSFKVYFPRTDVAEMVAETPSLVARPSTGAETVLVVEDADGLREVTRRLLLWQGYTVLVAHNADEAFHLFEQNPSIDVVLTDVVMPSASGSRPKPSGEKSVKCSTGRCASRVRQPRITWSQARTSHIAMADVACRGSGGAANEAAGPHASRPPRSGRRTCSQSYFV